MITFMIMIMIISNNSTELVTWKQMWLQLTQGHVHLIINGGALNTLM